MKKFIKIIGALFVLVVLASCTQSFCTVKDQAELLEQYYVDNIEAINNNAVNNGYFLPSAEFKIYMEEKVATEIAKDETVRKSFVAFAGLDANDNPTLWYNFDKWVEEAKADPEIGYQKVASADYINYFKQQMNSGISATRTCITPENYVFDNGNGVHLESVSWGQAFNYGPIEGLLVYPVSWLLHTFSVAFGANGWGQVGAILLVTVIVRALILAVSFKQTMSQQKINMIQPELARLQNKYPNANTNQYEKSHLAQEQMALYKKHGINPFGMFIVMLVQFPVFIAVWGAMSGTAILADGEILGLSLAITTSSAIFQLNWVAIILFLLMSAAQILSMKLPMIMQKQRTKNVEKLGKNPAAEKNASTMKWVNNIMMIMIIVMGFSLPVGMAIYWFIGALISIAQTLIIQHINNRKSSNTIKYKNKK